MNRYLLKKIIISFLLILFSSFLFCIDYTWFGGIGNWNDQTHWDSGDGTPGNDGYPDGNNDTATIDNGDSVTITFGGGAVTCGEVNIDGGSVLNLSNTLSVETGGGETGDFNFTTGTVNLSGNALNVDHDITIGGTLNAGGGDITIGEDWNFTGTFNPGGNEVIFNGAGGTIDATIFNDLRINSAGNTWTANGNISCNDDLAIANGILDIAATNLSVTGWFNNQDTLRRNGGTTAPEDNNSGLVIYYGAGGLIQGYGAGDDYNDLEIEGPGIFTTSQAIETNDDLVISGGTLNIGTDNLNVDDNCTVTGSIIAGTGNITVGNDLTGGGTVTCGSGTIDVNDRLVLTTFTASSTQSNVGGNYDVTNFTHNGGEIIFDTTAGSTITTNGQNMGNVEIAANKTLNDAMSCIDLEISAGTFNILGNLLDINHDLLGGGNLTSTGGNITIEEDWNLSGAFTHGNNTVTFDGAGGTINAATFYNLTIDSGGNTWSANGNINVDNDLDINAGELNILLTQLNIDHDITITDTLTSTGGDIYIEEDWNRTGTFNQSTSEVIFNGAGGTIDATTFNDLQINSAGNTWTANGNITCNDDLTITNGTLDIAGTNLAVTDVFNNLDTLRRNGGTSAPEDDNSGLVIYYGAGGLIQGYGAGDDYNDLEIEGPGTFTTDQAIETNDDLVISGGILNIGTDNLNVDDNCTVTGSITAGTGNITVGNDLTGGGTVTCGSGTIDVNDRLVLTTFTASSTQSNVGGNYDVTNFTHNGGEIIFDTTAGSTITTNGQNMGNVEIAANKTLNDNLDCIDLEISAGTLDGTGRTINISGDWNNTGGVFTSTGSLVNFDGNAGTQEIESNGSNFNDITISNDAGRTIQLLDTMVVNNDMVFNDGIFDFNGQDVTVTNDFTFDDGAVYFNGTPTLDIGNDCTINGGNFRNNAGGLIQANTRINVGNNFLARATNSNIELQGVGGGSYWILDVTGIAIAEDNGNQLNSSWSDASPGRPIAAANANTVSNCINWDVLAPYIVMTRAAVGSNIIYIEFNEAVCTNVFTTAAPDENNITYIDNNAADAGVINTMTVIGAGQYRFYLTLNAPLTYDDIVNDRIQCDLNEIIDFSSLAVPNNQEFSSYNENDNTINTDDRCIGINFFNDVSYNDLENRGRIWHVTDLDGDGKAGGRDSYVRAHLNVPALVGNTPRLFYDVLESSNDFWLPNINTAARTAAGLDRGNDYWEFIIPSSDSEIKDENELSFVMEIDTGVEIWYCYLLNGSRDQPQNSTETYRVLIKDISYQNNNVTILNNVINPHEGEITKMLYTLEKDGPVSIVVYDLKSDIVKVLKGGTQSAGTHAVTWNGKNENGKTVTRGVYFIRIRAPGIFNQIRKVLIIK